MTRGHIRKWLVVVAAAAALGPTTALAAGSTDVPVASFTTSPAAPAVGDVVTFDASSSHDPDGDQIAGYRWNFGDGDTQTTVAATTTHAFPKAGSFTAVLTVVDSHGNVSPAAMGSVTVTPSHPHAQARFKVSPKSPAPGQAVAFDASGSTGSPGATITSYAWSFGDGARQTTPGPITTHVYAGAGKFTATLTVTDSIGATDTVAHSVRVKQPSGYHVPVPPVARFTFAPARPSVGALVTFNASGSTGGAHKIKQYLWSFGDGSSQETRSPFAGHVFRRRGAVTVQLIVITGKRTMSAPAQERLTIVGSHRHHHAIRLSHLTVAVCKHRSRHCAKRGLRVRFKLSRRDSVLVTIARRDHRRHGVKRFVIVGRRGPNARIVAFIGARHRHYVLTATPSGGRGARTRFVW